MSMEAAPVIVVIHEKETPRSGRKQPAAGKRKVDRSPTPNRFQTLEEVVRARSPAHALKQRAQLGSVGRAKLREEAKTQREAASRLMSHNGNKTQRQRQLLMQEQQGERKTLSVEQVAASVARLHAAQAKAKRTKEEREHQRKFVGQAKGSTKEGFGSSTSKKIAHSPKIQYSTRWVHRLSDMRALIV